MDAKQELREVLLAHVARYPQMKALDAIKLIYQNEFGGGHLIDDPEKSMAYLKQEYEEVTASAAASSTIREDLNTEDPLDADPEADSGIRTEEIGNGIVRIYLDGLDVKRYPLSILNRDFVRSATLHQGRSDHFLEKLNVLMELASEGALPFSLSSLSHELNEYLEIVSDYHGVKYFPPVSHSDIYHDTYHPAYRIVKRRYSGILLAEALHRHAKALAPDGNPSSDAAKEPAPHPLLLAIDGRCGSGKSTLAENLHSRFGFSVIHLDHFYLRQEQRTPERYQEPGGNVDRERFLTEVLQVLKEARVSTPEAPQTFSYHPIEHDTFRVSETAYTMPVTPVMVIEGSYSMHPELRDYYDMTVFLHIEPAAQRERIQSRNGAELLKMFETRWIPLEEAYFAAYRPQDISDFYLTV